MKSNRFWSVLLTICMLVVLMAPAASAAQTTTLEHVYLAGVPMYLEMEPAAEMLQFEVPEGVRYEAAWLDEDWEPYEDYLKMGGTYYLQIELYAEEGYTFDSDAVFVTDVDETMIYFRYCYAERIDPEYAYIEIGYELKDPMPEVEICGVTAPVAGESPTVEGLSVPQGANYAIASARWYYWDENDEQAAVETFVAGKDYCLELTLDLPAHYTLSEYTNYQWDVDTSGYFYDGNILTLDFYVPGAPITELSVQGTPASIQAGQKASLAGITIPADAPYTLEAAWQIAVNGEWETFEGTFCENENYRLNLEFRPVEGYQIETVEVLVNGEAVGCYGMSNSWLGMEILFPLTREISQVELLGVQEPQAGLQVDLSALQLPTDANYSLEYAYWYDADTYEQVTDCFVKGKDYVIQAKLVPNEGYHFAQDVILMVNGQETEAYWGDLLYLEYWNEVSLKDMIEKVDITGVTAPVIGQVPVTEGIAAEHCEVVAVWVSQNGDIVEIFEDNKRYMLIIELYPEVGYTFSGNTQITIDGEPINGYGYTEESYGYVYQGYSFCDVLPAVSVQLPTVALGQAVPREAVVPEGADYYTEISWYTWSHENGYEAYEEDVFVDGKMYNMDLYVYPNEGYGFDPTATRIEVIGGDPTVMVSESEIYLMQNFNFSDTPVIDNLELVNVQPAKVGEKATAVGIGLPQNVHYTVTELTWMGSFDGDLNGVWWEVDTFEAGNYYALMLRVEAEPGYVFDWKPAVYINGAQADVYIYGDNGYGSLVIPLMYGQLQETQLIGDFTGDGNVNNEDVVLLLWHTLFPAEYPIADGDVTGDGNTNNEDVVLLLWHTLFPEEYPL